jgi:transglutaminase-like putative cysteine protease
VTTTRAERALVAGACATAGLASATFLPWDAVVAPVCVAAVASTVLVAASRRLSPPLVLLCSAVVYVAVAGAAVFPGTTVLRTVPTLETLAALRSVLEVGWRDLLSARVPAPPAEPFVAIPFTATWLAAASGTWLLETRWRLLPVIPADVAFVLMVLLGDHASGRPRTQLVAFVALAGILALRRTPGRSPVSAVGGYGVVALLAVASALVVAAAPGVDAQSTPQLRSLVRPEVRPRSTVNPLAALGTNEISLEIGVTVHGWSGDPLRVPVVALDDYDGVRWSATGTYVRTGPELPASSVTSRGQRVRQAYEVRSSSLPWLPTVGRPVRLAARAGDVVGVDENTDGLAVDGETRYPLRYVVHSVVPPVPTEAELRRSDIALTVAAYRARPSQSVSSGLSAVASRLTLGAQSPFDQVARVAAFLRDDRRINKGRHFVVDPTAPAGFAAHQVERFVADDPTGRTGPPKMFVAAFAALLRELGIPARVVLGFELKEPRDGISATLTEKDLSAWAEVNLAGHGWTAFDPVPGRMGTAPTDTVEAALNDSVDEATTTAGTEGPEATDRPTAPPLPPRENDGSPWWPLAILTAVVALAAAAAPRALRAVRRWRRQHAPSPEERIVGAWLEAVDVVAAADGGRPASAYHVTAAVHAAGRLGPDAVAALRELGARVNAACFASTEAGVADSIAAWEAEGDFRRTARRARRQSRMHASAESAGSGPETRRTTTQ